VNYDGIPLDWWERARQLYSSTDEEQLLELMADLKKILEKDKTIVLQHWVMKCLKQGFSPKSPC